MENIQNEIVKVFGNKLRIRVSGICIEDEKILLVKHHSLGEKGILWAPPGGGIIFGETAEESLKREFQEETGLDVKVKKFLFVYEYLKLPLHAIELFFEVEKISGTLKTGTDPEMDADKQIIHDVKFFSIKEIQSSDASIFHGLFAKVNDIKTLRDVHGYYQENFSGKNSKKS